jgi:hypothetical protein
MMLFYINLLAMTVLSEGKGSCNALYGGKEFLMTVLGGMEVGRYSGRLNVC